MDCHDKVLLVILKEEGNFIDFFRTIFGFLYRCTDFYFLNKNEGDLGLLPGVAESTVMNVYNQWRQLYEETHYVYIEDVPAKDEIDIEELNGQVQVLYGDDNEVVYEDGDEVVCEDGQEVIYEGGHGVVYEDGDETVFEDGEEVVYVDGGIQVVYEDGDVQEKREGRAYEDSCNQEYIENASEEVTFDPMTVIESSEAIMDGNVVSEEVILASSFEQQAAINSIVQNEEEMEDKSNTSLSKRQSGESGRHGTVEISNKRILIQLKEKPFKCHFCPRAFAQKFHLREHTRTHTKEDKVEIEQKHDSKEPLPRRFKCRSCPLQFRYSFNLKTHVFYMHGEGSGVKRFICNICGKAFRRKYPLTQHVLQTHVNISDEKSFICVKCDAVCRNKREYKEHLLSKHSPYKCNTCHKNFRGQLWLDNHVRREHPDGTDIKVFKCEFCQQIYPRKHSLKRHLLTSHLQEKSFECKFCTRTFPQQSFLDDHFVVCKQNPQDNATKCHVCGKEFTRKYSLRNHVKLHSRLGEVVYERKKAKKVYQCDTCGKISPSCSQLKQHIQSNHAKEKPYTCVCGNRFNFKYHLVRHMRTVHKQESKQWKVRHRRCNFDYEVSL